MNSGAGDPRRRLLGAERLPILAASAIRLPPPAAGTRLFCFIVLPEFPKWFGGRNSSRGGSRSFGIAGGGNNRV